MRTAEAEAEFLLQNLCQKSNYVCMRRKYWLGITCSVKVWAQLHVNEAMGELIRPYETFFL